VGLSPAFVSYVFQEKRHLSPQLAVKVAKNLDWSDQEQKYFLSLIEIENPKTDIGQRAALEQIKRLRTSKWKTESLEADVFAAISGWHHNAILSFLNLENTKRTIQTISQRLKLDKLETEAALYRLKKLGLVEVSGNEWTPTHNLLSIKGVSSSAIRNYHKQVLKMAAEALDQQAFEEREFSSLTITVDPKHLEQAKKKIREFTHEMAQLLDGSDASEIYQCSVQLFRLTQAQAGQKE
jgi:uncharacterized protein (TIGR02147 family)